MRKNFMHVGQMTKTKSNRWKFTTNENIDPASFAHNIMLRLPKIFRIIGEQRLTRYIRIAVLKEMENIIRIDKKNAKK